jgi:hypothetical protein
VGSVVCAKQTTSRLEGTVCPQITDIRGAA